MSRDYKEKMEHVREVYEQRKAAAAREKGLIVVFTGNGKGKSTAAWGMALRAIAHGIRVAVVQFVKGAIPCGETEAFRAFGELVEWHRLGEGFTWITQDEERDRRAARRAWEKSLELLHRPGVGLLILDEINVALRKKQLPLEEVLEGLRSKPEQLHVALTGRGAPEELIELADLVSEIKMVKHPYRAGVKPQKGIEF